LAAVAAEIRAPRVALRTLGCKVNRSESEALAEDLLARGVAVAPSAEGADVVVINTCTVTGEADAKARKAIRGALASGGAGRLVIVMGCLAAIDPDAIRALGPRVIVEADRARVADRVAQALGVPSVGGEYSPGAERPRDAAFRTRVMVKVQDGCDRRCSYCIVPDARGGPRSVAADDVVRRVSHLVEDGTREIVLTGINIGRYSDPAAIDLARLVERIAGTGVQRIRVSSIEPPDLTDGLLGTLASVPSVMPHLHVPLQSGCDGQLATMGRGYTAAGFADTLERVRAALAGPAITTDVIVGFPGESDDDFQASLAFVEECSFAKLHVFRYSRRGGTPAAEMPGQIDPREKASRAEAMRAAGDRASAAYAASRVGGRAAVLVERAVGDGVRGTSEDHLTVTVRCTGRRAQPGELLAVRLVSAAGAEVEGVSSD
jgi:threonylcarbamoyladenosine tRNA methylthiotransferase MtaB